jgi:hypothetical protein
MNYENLKKFLRVSRLSIELMGEVNSEALLKEISGDYADGLSCKQQKILAHIKKIELELLNPTMSIVKRQLYTLEKLTGQKIPKSIFSLEPINNN